MKKNLLFGLLGSFVLLVGVGTLAFNQKTNNISNNNLTATALASVTGTTGVIPTPISPTSTSSCANVNITTSNGTLMTYPDGSSSVKVINFAVQNTGTCSYYLNGIDLVQLSGAGSYNFGKLSLINATTNSVISANKQITMEYNQHGYSFGGLIGGAVTMLTIPAGQTVNFYVKADYLRNTNVFDPVNSAPSLISDDYFAFVINKVSGFDSSMNPVTPNYVSKFGNIITVH